MSAPNIPPGPRPAPLTDDEQRAWQAIRLRLADAAPWLSTALYRATPVAVTSPDDGSQPGWGQAPATADRWGRVYIDFRAETDAGIGALTRTVEAALLTWLERSAVSLPWHVPPSDPDFPAVETAEIDRLARTTARRYLDHPPPRSSDWIERQWQRFAARLAGPPQVPWQQTLSAYLRTGLSAAADSDDYTFTRLSRHSRPGIAIPALTGHALHVTVVADVSPSVVLELPAVFVEIERIAAACGVTDSGMRLLAVDHEVRASVSWRERNQVLTVREEGRTDMRVGIAAAVSAVPRPDVIVVLTDGFTPWPARAPGIPVIVTLIGPRTVAVPRPDVPAWAATVTITIDPDEDAP